MHAVAVSTLDVEAAYIFKMVAIGLDMFFLNRDHIRSFET
jgi:hypothetical protein